MPSLREVVALLDGWYRPQHAEDWDAVGLVLGDPADYVRRILLAVDPVAAVVDEAVLHDADLLITHHPLFLRGVHGFAATTYKGRLAHRLVTNRCALFTAHTNADSPAGGVSDAIAHALGLVDVHPLGADRSEPRDKLVVFVPVDAAEGMRDALAEAGAGRIGNYDQASFSSRGQGRFRPLEDASPAIGERLRHETVEEERVEVVLPRVLRPAVLETMVRAHPYEEPAYDVVELAALEEPDRGSGRLGHLLKPMSLREFAELVDRTLPQTAHGVRVAGDPEQVVRQVALCGGAGDFLLDRARGSGADVYLTSDLRHHPASELREQAATGHAPALVDVAHWAAESMWLPVLAERLLAALPARSGDTVEIVVSAVGTDPWTFRV